MARRNVACSTEIPNGGMKQTTVGSTDVLLVRLEGRVAAYSAHCPHYGAPLAEGTLEGSRLLCPWHQAVFDLRDGEVLEPPALDCLAAYECGEADGQIWVDLPADPSPSRRPRMASRQPGEDRTIAVVGAGAAGLAAAQELRRVGFTGGLVLIGAEADAPYDRPNLSKAYLAGEAPAEWLPLRPPEFYDEADIERRVAVVESVAVTERALRFGDGSSETYDGLILATGAEPRRLDVPGADLGSVFTLRSLRDAERIAAAADAAQRVVVVGASFIGMEVASSLRERGIEHVTVVAPEEVPFARLLGEVVGRAVLGLHEQHGVSFCLGTTVERFDGDDRVRSVTLADGKRLEADLVVVGVGVTPRTRMVEGADLAEDGGINVDPRLRVADGVYAAGDIARFPDPWTGASVRIEHWRVALQQGQTAARNLLGAERNYRRVPFFWTRQHGTSIGVVGHAARFDAIRVHGRPQEMDFVAYLLSNGRVHAVAAAGRGDRLAAFHEMLQRGDLPSASIAD